jgi:hypothetical protein
VLPVDLGAAVNRIEWSGDEVEILTSKESISSKLVIVTVSTGVLAANRIHFEPGLPDATRASCRPAAMIRVPHLGLDEYGYFHTHHSR